jgi:putative metallohydrolase (TIGR04338 family)
VPASAVYAAEDQWSAVLDRGGVVDFFGSRLDVPMQRRFGDVASVQAYVESVLGQQQVRAAYPQAGAITVRGGRSRVQASYLPELQVIDLPGELWAGRESVVLHEIAHHLACSAGVRAERGSVRWHGLEFRAAMDLVVTTMLGEAAALLLRAGYDAAGVR